MTENLTLLGSANTTYPTSPDQASLEAIENQWSDQDYIIDLDCHEFTCLCPKTGQPDFAKIYISYVPGESLVESKALKLYLFSYRNEGIFHEFVINKIARDLNNAINAKYIKVVGDFMPRGGIAIKPVVQLGDLDLYRSLRGNEMAEAIQSGDRN
ncbi:MAG: preQ(1) synthase [Candidatus Melainabacteria bacterium]|nr:preQ(1) synthase [Candidatus Melainabacteria bacterium]